MYNMLNYWNECELGTKLVELLNSLIQYQICICTTLNFMKP